MKLRIAAFALVAAFVAAPVLAAQPAAQPSGPKVLKMDVSPDISLADAAESMRIRANALNLKLVAEMPLSEQVAATVGKPQRVITIFQFCDAVTAKDLIDADMELAIYMPCRIALVEDEKGRGHLVMMDMDIEALAKDKHLSAELVERMNKVRASLGEIMKAGAEGEL